VRIRFAPVSMRLSIRSDSTHPETQGSYTCGILARACRPSQLVVRATTRALKKRGHARNTEHHCREFEKDCACPALGAEENPAPRQKKHVPWICHIAPHSFRESAPAGASERSMARSDPASPSQNSAGGCCAARNPPGSKVFKQPAVGRAMCPTNPDSNRPSPTVTGGRRPTQR